MESFHKFEIGVRLAVADRAARLDRHQARGRRGKAGMPSNYNLKCPVARTLDIIGERWTILILRDLFLQGPRKFQDFEQSLARISPTTLSARLKKLEEHGIVARKFYAEHPPRAEYVLTDRGRSLGPLMKMLLDWGTKHAR
jgi:DNA-binding HxlR family transcriptional regulator